MDGFASTGPNDEQQWVTWAWEQIRPQVLELADSSDTILIGRKLAVDYIPYWEGVMTRPEEQLYEVAPRIVNARKIVFTKTLDKSIWERTELAKGDLVQEVTALKRQPGKDIIVYGGTSFVAALVKANLIDEFHFFVNPVVIGKGESVFSSLDAFRQLQLKKTITYDCGIVLLHYEPGQQAK